MRQILGALDSTPWKRALQSRPEEEVRAAYRMMTNLDRANWHLLLPLPTSSVVLDVGAGSGTIAHALALHYDSVVALEPVHERVEFMRRRFGQEGLSNVTIVRSDSTMLPFAPQTFDLIALNGVLEWIPWSDREGSPREVQLRALRRLRALLKPGGWLYIGIENRLNLDYFLGARDPHADIPWVTVLPRRLADLYARRRTGEPYRMHLYSYWGYRKLLRDAGFASSNFYDAIESYNDPRFLVPCESRVYHAFLDTMGMRPTSARRRWLARFLRAVRLLQYSAYSFAILVRNPVRETTPARPGDSFA